MVGESGGKLVLMGGAHGMSLARDVTRIRTWTRGLGVRSLLAGGALGRVSIDTVVTTVATRESDNYHTSVAFLMVLPGLQLALELRTSSFECRISNYNSAPVTPSLT